MKQRPQVNKYMTRRIIKMDKQRVMRNEIGNNGGNELQPSAADTIKEAISIGYFERGRIVNSTADQ